MGVELKLKRGCWSIKHFTAVSCKTRWAGCNWTTWWYQWRSWHVFVFVIVFVFVFVIVFGKIGRMVWWHPDGDINEGAGSGKKDDISLKRGWEKERRAPYDKWILPFTGNVKVCNWRTDANFVFLQIVSWNLATELNDKNTLVYVANEEDAPDSCKEHL